MTQAAIATEIDQTLDRNTDFPAQIAFDRVLRNFVTDLLDFRLGEILDPGRRRDTRVQTDLPRP